MSSAIVRYNPLFAAANAMHKGTGSRYGRLHELLAKSAPLRAGLAIGLPVGGLAAGSTYFDDNVPEEDRLGAAVGAGLIAGGITGLTGASLSRTGHTHLKSLRGIATENFERGATREPHKSPTTRRAVEEVLRKSPDHVEVGVGRGFLGDIKKDVSMRDVDPYEILRGTQFPSSTRSVATNKMRHQILHAMHSGLTEPAPTSRAEQFLANLRRDMPDLTTRDLRKMLHPDAVARDSSIDKELAAEAFRMIPQSTGTQNYGAYQAAFDVGRDTLAKRKALLEQLEKERAKMFPNLTRLSTGHNELL